MVSSNHEIPSTLARVVPRTAFSLETKRTANHSNGTGRWLCNSMLTVVLGLLLVDEIQLLRYDPLITPNWN